MKNGRHGIATTPVFRWVTAAIGAALIGCAIAILMQVPVSNWLAIAAAATLLALGVDALVAAVRGRWPLVARIGPLP